MNAGPNAMLYCRPKLPSLQEYWLQVVVVLYTIIHCMSHCNHFMANGHALCLYTCILIHLASLVDDPFLLQIAPSTNGRLVASLSSHQPLLNMCVYNVWWGHYGFCLLAQQKSVVCDCMNVHVVVNHCVEVNLLIITVNQYESAYCMVLLDCYINYNFACAWGAKMVMLLWL